MLVWKAFYFSINFEWDPCWPTEFLLKDQLLSIWGFPCMLLVASPFLLFIILSLCLVFVSLISMCLGMFLLGFFLYRTLCLWDFINSFLFHVGELFNCNLGCRFFPFSTLNISCHSLVACRVSDERSAVKHMEFPLYVTCCFSLATLIFFLCV